MMVPAVRCDEKSIFELQAGEYSYKNGHVWLVLPNGQGPSHLAGDGVKNPWTVEEHEDGTISLSPSILDCETKWHGFLERGQWREV